MDTQMIIDGFCMDSCIGGNYNNCRSDMMDSYAKGYKAAACKFQDVTQTMMVAVVQSNSMCENFIAYEFISRNPKTVGIYCLIMKINSYNFRASAYLV